MRVVEKKIAELSSEYRQLRIEEAELKSLGQIEEKTKELGMAKPEKIQYIKETGPVAFMK